MPPGTCLPRTDASVDSLPASVLAANHFGTNGKGFGHNHVRRTHPDGRIPIAPVSSDSGACACQRFRHVLMNSERKLDELNVNRSFDCRTVRRPTPHASAAESRHHTQLGTEHAFSALGKFPTDRSPVSFRGFDQPSPTCYKSPFCAVVCPGPVVPPFPRLDLVQNVNPTRPS